MYLLRDARSVGNRRVDLFAYYRYHYYILLLLLHENIPLARLDRYWRVMNHVQGHVLHVLTPEQRSSVIQRLREIANDVLPTSVLVRSGDGREGVGSGAGRAGRGEGGGAKRAEGAGSEGKEGGRERSYRRAGKGGKRREGG